MRLFARFAKLAAMSAAMIALPSILSVSAAPGDTVADRVIGQPDFAHNQTNNGGVTAGVLTGPLGIAVDSEQNLWVADRNNNRVLEYDFPFTGTVATHVIGQPDFFQNAPNNGGVSARTLWSPVAVAVDSAGRLWVADQNNSRVLEYDDPLTDPVAARVFGQPDFSQNAANNGGVSATSLDAPTGVSLDDSSRLWVADAYNNRVLEYDTPLIDPLPNRVIGQPDFTQNAPNNTSDGQPDASSLALPFDVLFDGASGTLWVADYNNNRALGYSDPLNNPLATAVIGQPDFAQSTLNNLGVNASSLYNPTGLALDSAGRLLIADYSNNRVLEYDDPLTDPAATAVVGQPDFTENTPNNLGVSQYTLFRPFRPAVDNVGGWLFLADSDNNRVLKFASPLTTNAAATSVFGQLTFAETQPHGGVNANSLMSPFSASVDTGGRLWVADTGNSRVLEYDNSLTSPIANLMYGQPNFTTNEPAPPRADSLAFPYDATVDETGRLWVADSGNSRVLEYDSPLTNLVATRVFGQPDFTENTPNHGGVSGSSLLIPSSVAVDSAGRLWVADPYNNRVLEYDSPLSESCPSECTAVTANRVFGQPDFHQNTANNTESGQPDPGSLAQPFDIAVDATERLWVADTGNSRVLEYDNPLTNPVATRVFGQPDFAHNQPNYGGVVDAGNLGSARGLDIDPLGRLWVADPRNNRVLEYDNPLTNRVATRVFGQPDFTQSAPNNAGLNAASMWSPVAVATGANGQVWVTDTGNSRLLEYDNPIMSSTTSVGGRAEQPDLTPLPSTMARSVDHPTAYALSGAALVLVVAMGAGSWYLNRKRSA